MVIAMFVKNKPGFIDGSIPDQKVMILSITYGLAITTLLFPGYLIPHLRRYQPVLYILILLKKSRRISKRDPSREMVHTSFLQEVS